MSFQKGVDLAVLVVGGRLYGDGQEVPRLVSSKAGRASLCQRAESC